MEELLASESWDEFMVTKGGILALDGILELNDNLRGRIKVLDEEREANR